MCYSKKVIRHAIYLASLRLWGCVVQMQAMVYYFKGVAPHELLCFKPIFSSRQPVISTHAGPCNDLTYPVIRLLATLIFNPVHA